MTQASNAAFANHLRTLRKELGLSQQKFADSAELSCRHINFLENNRSKPSREMVLKIAFTLGLSLKNTNVLLRAAGFSSQFSDTPLAQETMVFVNNALQRILKQQLPYPAVVMSPIGDLLHSNEGALHLFSHFLPLEDVANFPNVYELFFSEQGIKPFVSNWSEFAPNILALIKQEVFEIDSLNPAFRLLKTLEQASGLRAGVRPGTIAGDSSPLFELRLKKNDLELAFFSTYTSFGTPHDVTLQELRIECFYPVDTVTQQFCEGLSTI